MASPNEVPSTINTLLVLKLNHILCGGGGEEEIGFFLCFYFLFLVGLSFSNPYSVLFACDLIVNMI